MVSSSKRLTKKEVSKKRHFIENPFQKHGARNKETDVIVKVGSETLHLHSGILSIYSPVLRDNFHKHKRENNSTYGDGSKIVIRFDEEKAENKPDDVITFFMFFYPEYKQKFTHEQKIISRLTTITNILQLSQQYQAKCVRNQLEHLLCLPTYLIRFANTTERTMELLAVVDHFKLQNMVHSLTYSLRSDPFHVLQSTRYFKKLKRRTKVKILLSRLPHLGSYTRDENEVNTVIEVLKSIMQNDKQQKAEDTNADSHARESQSNNDITMDEVKEPTYIWVDKGKTASHLTMDELKEPTYIWVDKCKIATADVSAHGSKNASVLNNEKNSKNLRIDESYTGRTAENTVAGTSKNSVVKEMNVNGIIVNETGNIEVVIGTSDGTIGKSAARGMENGDQGESMVTTESMDSDIAVLGVHNTFVDSCGGSMEGTDGIEVRENNIDPAIIHIFGTAKEDCDLIVKVENHILHLHSAILCYCSPVFKTMLNGNFMEATTKEIILKDKKAEHVIMLFEFCYSDNVQKLTGKLSETTNYGELLALCQEYQMDWFVGVVEKYLVQNYRFSRTEDQIQGLLLADKFNLKALRKGISYTKSAVSDLCRREGFNELSNCSKYTLARASIVRYSADPNNQLHDNYKEREAILKFLDLEFDMNSE